MGSGNGGRRGRVVEEGKKGRNRLRGFIYVGEVYLRHGPITCHGSSVPRNGSRRAEIGAGEERRGSATRNAVTRDV